MKKFVIYLLALTMILSPMTAFAVEGDPVEDEGQVPVEELQDQDAEVTEEAAPAEDAEAVEEAAPAAEEEAVETEETAEEAAPAAEEEAVVEEEQEDVLKAAAMDWNENCTWDDENARNQAFDSDGNLVKGLFKAKRKYLNQGTSLFYSDDNGNVVKEERIVTITNGRIFKHTNVEGEQWKPNGTGTATYAITNHKDGTMSEYYVYWQQGLKAVNGKTYYIQDDGTVKTTAGIQQIGSSRLHT